MGSGAKRLLTAAVLVPAMLAAYFALPASAFFVVCLVVVQLAVVEYVGILRALVPAAPLASLHLLVPALATALWVALRGAALGPREVLVAGLGAVGAILLGCLVLFSRTPASEALGALGAIGFALPYFAVPIACLAATQADDPWLIFLLSAIVFLGDTAAYYIGSKIGRHRLAPTVSPKKSWEGAIASVVMALLATTVWSWWRLGAVGWEALVVALLTSVAAQVGDLVESLLKRGAHIKDSGALLPGHGGMLDRLDAMLFAAPIFYGAVHLLGVDVFVP